MNTRVIKLGGSLLDWPDLRQRLAAWIRRQSPAANLLVVGGGKLVEAIRNADRAQGLDAGLCHELSLEAMSITAALARPLLAAARLCRTLADFDLGNTSEVQIMDVRAFLVDDARSPRRLPASWQVTSDSIAARLAAAVEAVELVLLKSALPPCDARDALAGSGYVDQYFARACGDYVVRCVNLRAANFDEVVVRH